MTNDKIKKLFEERFKYSRHNFIYWLEKEECTKNEMDLFIKFLNQLKDKEVLKYIENDGTILSMITNQSDNLCKLAVNQSPYDIEYIKNQKKEICEIAINKNPFVIDLIKEQTIDLCLLALEKTKTDQLLYTFVRIVPNPSHEITLKNLKEKKAILNALK